ncbi:keratin, type I cytoskeletal 18 [Ictalurus punctatus]|uniref:Keratin, type I cytoskeletal 18 n=1 Tax=Ictalurus punctatus TaxID=7998 RepID=A0A2D0R5C8_ICTPU|nr:keratin, type I cytoskeletal 18 [Ictalurus punctatus]
MSRGPRASSLGAEARFGRERSPVRFGASFNRMSSTGGAMHPGEEKETMRGLNERLAGYLGQVRLLEEANNKLEAQIKEVLKERRAAGQRDWSGYENTLSTLRNQVKEMTLDNARLMLHIDNSRLAADDFKVKLEAEIAVRQGVEQDITNLRKMIDDTHMNRMQLESEVEALTEELIFLKKSHEEDVASVKGQIRDATVDVQMDAAKGQDLSETIDKIRHQYAKAAQKNREETEAWYQAKFENISAEVSRNTDALQQGQSELSDLRRQKQQLEIELQGMHSMNRSLEDTLNDTVGHCSRNVNNHNMVIQQLEAELADVLAQVKRQGAEYEALINIKSKLEEEIAVYHSLLAGTGLPSSGVPDFGLPEYGDSRGMGAREDFNIKNTGPPEDANVIDNGAFEDANIGGVGLDGDGESVEFSLEQALSAEPRYLIPDPILNNEIVEEQTVVQKDLELNSANTAMNKQYDQKEDGQGMEEDRVIEEEMEKEEETVVEVQAENEEEPRTVSPVEDTVAEKAEEEEMVSLVEDILVEKESTEYTVEDVNVEKVEDAVSLVVHTQVEKVEDAVSLVVHTQVEKVEDAVSPVVHTQVEKVEDAVSLVVHTQVEKVEDTASPVVHTQVEKAASPVEDNEAKEEVELKPTVENPEAEALQNVEE